MAYKSATLIDKGIPCSKCNKTGAIFYSHKSNGKTCAECRINYGNKYHQVCKHRKNKYAQKLARDRKLWAIEYKGGKCADCNGVFHPCVFEFHHIKDDKLCNPSVALRNSLKMAKAEIDKCILLCSNCHQMRSNWYDLRLQ